MIFVTVVIATSCGRTELLRDRSLVSVYLQRGVDPSRVRVVVVDDNAAREEFDRVCRAVRSLRASLDLRDDHFPTTCTRNARTSGHSGTGAWNTALDRMSAEALMPASWVAFLDDDDEYLPDHLAACLGGCEGDVVGVFERLEWVRSTGVEPRPFGINDLTPEAFFVGNPGVQGSNMFIEFRALQTLGGFDETLPNTTDRDMMIRLLRYAQETGRGVRALESVGARYHDHDGPRVNTDMERKHLGLARFYERHARDFSEASRRASYERARRLFGYEPRP